MEYKTIEELTTVVTGGTPSTSKPEYWKNGNIPWLQSGCCQNCEVNRSEKYISKLGYDNSSAQMMPKNSVMVALTGATAGKIGYLNFEACGNQSITGIFPCNEINQRFLFYYLISQRNKILADCVGGAQPHISQGYVKKIKVPIYNIEKQNRIVKRFDLISNIIKNDEKEIEKYDDLIKARFVEMFSNNNYPILKWCEVFNTTTGRLDSNASVENGKYPFFTCSKDILKIDSYAFDQKALLLAGNNAAGKYDVKYYSGKFNAYQRTYVLGLKDNWSYQLFKYQLEDKLTYLQQQSLGGLTKYLTMKILEQLDFIVPPIEKQLEFDDFVKQVDKSKLAVQQSLEKTQQLFDSLMQKYFG